MLMRKRGAPVLIELMRGRPAEAVGAPRPVGDAPVGRAEMTPLPRGLEADAAGMAGLSGGGGSVGSGEGVWWARPWYLVAGGMAVVLVVWAVGYSFGHSAGERAGEDKIRQVVSEDPLARAPVSDPLANARKAEPVAVPAETAAVPRVVETPARGNSGGAGSGTTGRAAGGAAPAAGANATTPAGAAQGTANAAGADGLPAVGGGVVATLQVGLNYLVVADLGKEDAEAAAAYLRGKGVPTGLVPQRSTVQVVVLRGYPGEVFADRKPERAKLEAVVKKLGRDWKVENRRAPTDFAQVFWAKLRE